MIKFVIRLNISEKGGITDSINHNFVRTKIDSFDSLATEKILTFHNVIIPYQLLIQITMNTTICFEKSLYKDKSNTEYF